MKIKNKTFKEQYQITLNYKSNSKWIFSHKINVFVDVLNNEKNNHDKAIKIARKMFPNCKITRVDYI